MDYLRLMSVVSGGMNSSLPCTFSDMRIHRYWKALGLAY